MELRKAVDNLLIYDPQFQYFAERFIGDMGGSSAIQAVGCMDDLKTAINSYTNVKFLEILLHGNPGGIVFANKGGMTGDYLGDLVQNTLFLQRNARILFDSCAIGAGESGDRFMEKLGKKMLTGKGGIIGASTVITRIYPFSIFFDEFSDGRLKVKKYDMNGNQVGSLTVDRYGNKY